MNEAIIIAVVHQENMVMKVMMVNTISLLDVRLATGIFLKYLMIMATLLLRAVLTSTRIVDTKK